MSNEMSHTIANRLHMESCRRCNPKKPTKTQDEDDIAQAGEWMVVRCDDRNGEYVVTPVFCTAIDYRVACEAAARILNRLSKAKGAKRGA